MHRGHKVYVKGGDDGGSVKVRRRVARLLNALITRTGASFLWPLQTPNKRPSEQEARACILESHSVIVLVTKDYLTSCRDGDDSTADSSRPTVFVVFDASNWAWPALSVKAVTPTIVDLHTSIGDEFDARVDLICELIGLPPIGVRPTGLTSTIVEAPPQEILLPTPGSGLPKNSPTIGQRVYSAANGGHDVILKSLLTKYFVKEVVNWPNDKHAGRSPLIAATRHGHVKAVKMLLSRPSIIDVNQATTFGATALMAAVSTSWGRDEQPRLKSQTLPTNSPRASSPPTSRASPSSGWKGLLTSDLSVEVPLEHSMNILRLLLATPGLKINLADNRGWTALITAAYCGRKELVALLLERPEIDVNSSTNDGKTAIVKAAAHGHVEIVRMLLQAGAYINACDLRGNSAALFAASKGLSDILHVLSSESNAMLHINLANDEGWTPFTCAASEGRVQVVKALLEKDIERRAYEYMKSLAQALGGTTTDEVVQQHDERDYTWPDLHKPTKTGSTALMLACAKGHTKVVEVILNSTSTAGITGNGNAETCDLNNATTSETMWSDINDRDNRGLTALMLAVMGGKLEVVELLLSAPGIQVNVRAGPPKRDFSSTNAQGGPRSSSPGRSTQRLRPHTSPSPRRRARPEFKITNRTPSPTRSKSRHDLLMEYSPPASASLSFFPSSPSASSASSSFSASASASSPFNATSSLYEGKTALGLSMRSTGKSYSHEAWARRLSITDMLRAKGGVE